MNPFTQTQLDAILDAQEQPEFADKRSAEVAELLRQRGHPAFAGAPAPAPTATATATAPLPAPSPAPASVRAAVGGLPLPPPRAVVTAELVGGATTVASPPASPQPPSPNPALPATREQHLPAAPAASLGAEGGETLDQHDIRIPRLSIQQPSSDGEAEVEPGLWVLSSDPDGAHAARVVQILDVTKGREWLLPYRKARESAEIRAKVLERYGMKVPEDRQIVCRSADRVAPQDLGYGGVCAAACAKCPHAQWTTIGGQRAKPECGEFYRLLFLDRETGLPAFGRVRSSAIAPFQNFLTLLMVRAGQHPSFAGQKGQKAPFGAFRVTLGTKRVEKTGSTPYYVPTFTQLTAITDPTEIEQAVALRRAVLQDPRVVEDEGDERAAGGEA